MNEVTLFTLSSGLRCVWLPVSSPVAYCALSTLAGTRFENRGASGLAHLTEHMLFKGTVKRRSYHINNRLERVGGELNAFTTKEELVLHATVLREDLSKALELFADLVLHSTVPDKELVKEKEIILDEISSYKDSPNDLIFDEFEEKMFAGSPLALPILGTSASLNQLKREQILAYIKERFHPANMVLSIAVQAPLALVMRRAERYFGKDVFGSVEAPHYPSCSCEPVKAPAFTVESKRKTHQIHCLTGVRAYNLHHPGRVAMVLLMNILAGPASNAKLNMLLREQHGLVYNVEGAYTPYSDDGYAGIYFGTDKGKLDMCLTLIDKTLKEAAQTACSGLNLERAKKQFIAQMAIAEDNLEVQNLSLGKHLLYFDTLVSHEKSVELIRSLTPSDLLEAAQCFAMRSTLIYV